MPETTRRSSRHIQKSTLRPLAERRRRVLRNSKSREGWREGQSPQSEAACPWGNTWLEVGLLIIFKF